MSALEAMMNNVENLGVSGDETQEFAGPTKIGNFEGCTLLSNEQLASYLNETLPPSHLEGCPRIESPEKYVFLHDYVFAGREYPPAIMAYWDYDSAGNQIEVTHSGVYDLSSNRIAWGL